MSFLFWADIIKNCMQKYGTFWGHPGICTYTTAFVAVCFLSCCRSVPPGTLVSSNSDDFIIIIITTAPSRYDAGCCWGVKPLTNQTLIWPWVVLRPCSSRWTGTLTFISPAISRNHTCLFMICRLICLDFNSILFNCSIVFLCVQRCYSSFFSRVPCW